MTPFEQQVAEALAHDPTRHVDGSAGDIFVNVGQLAPRVAAAIGAMGAAHSDGVHWQQPNCEQCALNVQFGIPAALAALRGARRAPAETPE